jgi:hypothetical protein
MKIVHNKVKKQLEVMNIKYKENTYERRRHREFEMGDEVMVYLRKYFFPFRTYNKLKMKKFGPCKIIKKIDSINAYAMELQETLSISPIFYIAYLYQYQEENFSEKME